MAKKRIQGTDRLFEETEAITSIFIQGEEPTAVQRNVPLNRLVPNRFNPRQAYSKEALAQLATSMEKYGFIGALDGRELPDGRVELAYGSRRLLAAKTTSIQAVPVFLHDWDDGQMRFIALVENLAREDLTPLDEATTVGKMHDELGLSTREISRRIGRPRSWVQDRLALLNAPQDVRDLVVERPDTLRSARFIARLPLAEDRFALRDRVLDQEITTRQVQQVVQQVEQGASVADALASISVLPRPRGETSPAQAAQASPALETPVAAAVPTAGEAPSERGSAEPPPDVLMTMVMPSEAPAEDLSQIFAREAPVLAGLSDAQQTAASPREMGAEMRKGALTGGAALMPERGWVAAGSPLIVLAVEALDSFNPEGLAEDELVDAVTWLRQLASRTNLLLHDLEERL